MLNKSIAILFFLVSLKAVNSDRGGPHGAGPHGAGPHGGARIPNLRFPVPTRDNLCTTAIINAGIFLPDHQPPDAPFVCALCTDNSTFLNCSITASRCYTRLGPDTKSTIRAAFCDCKDNDTEVKALFTEWVISSNGGYDPCNATQTMLVGPFGIRPDGNRGEHVFGGPGSFRHPPHRMSNTNSGFTAFMQALNISNPIKQASLECCLSQKIGLFEDGRANITAWNIKAERKPDGVAENAIKLAITQCASSTAICSVRAFQHCIMSTCFNELQLISSG